MKIVRVLWITRHKPLDFALDELKGIIMKKTQCSSIEIDFVDRTFNSYKDVVDEIEKHKSEFVVMVLPKLMQLSAMKYNSLKNVVWLRQVMKLAHPGTIIEEPCMWFISDKDWIYYPEGRRFPEMAARIQEELHLRFSHFEKVIVTNTWKKEELITTRYA